MTRSIVALLRAYREDHRENADCVDERRPFGNDFIEHERCELCIAADRILGTVELEDPAGKAPRPPKKHPDCVAAMCGVNDCRHAGPCYVRVAPGGLA